ncbi:hypothetical protein [Zoogloea sp.]|jgi:hypothetical protein|uniref:hypothetical protein n=1 Tax=Zoogloea sp. TaxID=49181 RepID=UPI0035B46220
MDKKFQILYMISSVEINPRALRQLLTRVPGIPFRIAFLDKAYLQIASAVLSRTRDGDAGRNARQP